MSVKKKNIKTHRDNLATKLQFREINGKYDVNFYTQAAESTGAGEVEEKPKEEVKENRDALTKIEKIQNTIVKQVTLIMKWFQGGYLRMYFGLTFIWCSLLFLFLFGYIGRGDPDITILRIILLSFFIGMGGALYILMITAGPIARMIDEWYRKRESNPPSWIDLFLFMFFGLPFWIYGWIPKKAYEQYFYKFTNYHIGTNLFEKGKYQESISELEKYRVSPNNPEETFFYFIILGDCHTAVGKYGEAIKYYQRAVDYFSDVESAQTRLALAYILNNQHDEGLRLARTLYEQNTENTEILGIISRSYIMLGMHDDALVYLQKAISLSPMNPAFHKMLAEVYWDKGMSEEAFNSASKALSLNPTEDIAGEAKAIIDFCKESPEETLLKDKVKVVSSDIFCIQCGSKNPPNSHFCMECGYRIE